MSERSLRAFQITVCALSAGFGLHVGGSAGNCFAALFAVLAGLAVLAS